MSKIITTKENVMKSRWFVVPKPNESAAIRLFCFPYAAGNAATYVSWHERLPEEVELVAIQPPGRASRIEEKGIESMQELVEELCCHIEPLIDRPYVLFGHSLGSRIAFEFALEAQKRNWRLPSHFIASGSNAPYVCRQHKRIHHLNDEAFVEGLKRFQGPTEIIANNPKLLELFMPLLRADFSVADTYYRSAEEKLSCEASIFGGDEDTDAPEHQLSTWQAHLLREISEIVVFRGNHFYIENNKNSVIDSLNLILNNVIQDAIVNTEN